MRNLIFLFIAVFLMSCQGKPNLMSTVAPGMVFPADYNPADFSELKVVSWNVEHFVDTFDNPYIDNDRENNPSAKTLERIKLLSEALKEIDADIVVLQEFESESFARWLSENEFPELGYQYFSASESPTWYMNVVIMSRVPLGTHYGYGRVFTPVVGMTNDDGTQQSQDYINTRMWSIDVIPREDYVVTMTGVHLKAGRGERNEGFRKGQYRFLKGQYDRFLNERPEANILLVGDLNSLPESPELTEFLLPGEKVQMINPTAGVETLTHSADDPSRQLDYVLYNEKLEPEVVEDSVKIAMPLNNEKMARIADHLPMEITISIGDQ